MGDLQLTQLQAGDCLTGANLQLNKNTPWPKLSQAVPCTQAHTAEVFYANNNFWAKSGAYPGDAAIKKAATAECDSAFQSYVGIAYSQVALHLDRHRAGRVHLAERRPGAALRRLLRDERSSRPA